MDHCIILAHFSLEYSGGAWSSTGSAGSTHWRDELDFHEFSPDTQSSRAECRRATGRAGVAPQRRDLPATG
jgi:hypothetical protein